MSTCPALTAHAVLHAQVVWHRTQKRVGLMLNTACRALGTAQPVQAVQALVKLTEQFASVGEEYSGGDAPALRHSMQQFCSEYFGQVLQGATESLRTLLEMDTWQRMRVSIEKMGGIVGAVQRRRSVTSLQEAAAVAASPVVCSHMVPSSAFQFMTVSMSMSRKVGSS